MVAAFPGGKDNASCAQALLLGGTEVSHFPGRVLGKCSIAKLLVRLLKAPNYSARTLN
jgi:hypothetical protein